MITSRYHVSAMKQPAATSSEMVRAGVTLLEAIA
jgi:hypothetical protein